MHHQGRNRKSARPPCCGALAHATLLVVAVVVCACVSPVHAQDDNWYNRHGAINTFNPDWMTRLPDNILITELSLPGTHDTMSRCLGYTSAVCDWLECQTLTLATQLNAGIRVLDIRCRHVHNRFAIHHAVHQADDFRHLAPGETDQLRVQGISYRRI